MIDEFNEYELRWIPCIQQEFEGTFMTEAKDWAGELISGQTTTGRILVSMFNKKYDDVQTRSP